MKTRANLLFMCSFSIFGGGYQILSSSSIISCQVFVNAMSLLVRCLSMLCHYLSGVCQCYVITCQWYVSSMPMVCQQSVNACQCYVNGCIPENIPTHNTLYLRFATPYQIMDILMSSYFSICQLLQYCSLLSVMAGYLIVFTYVIFTFYNG